MSAIGTKRTSACALQMSLLGVKRTCLFALHMSAYDPRRTSPLTKKQALGCVSFITRRVVAKC